MASRTFALDVPFDRRSTATAHGARWSKKHKVHLYEGSALPEALAAYASRPHSWERWVETEENGGSEPSGSPTPNGPKKMTPRPHQAEAIDLMTRAKEDGRTGFLLADDVGLGKTISCWGAVRRIDDAQTVLVVAPLSVVPHWRRTIEAMGAGDRRIVVMNYERLDRLFDVPEDLGRATVTRKKGRRKVKKKTRTRKIRSKKGVAKYGTAMKFDVVIVDESHKLKNPTSARSKLMRQLIAKADFTYWLSATAGQNPLELSYLAPLLTELTGRRVPEMDGFEDWCAEMGLGVARGNFGRWEWAGDDADIERMRALLFDPPKNGIPGALRRRPTDVAGWPELQRIATPMELDAEQADLYATAWSEFRDALEMSAGTDSEHALVAQLRFRQKASLVRLGATVELVQELLANGRQVTVSVAFEETLQELRRRLEGKGASCAVIFGGLTGDAREAERIAFQKGGRQVAIYTVEEGISLHQGEDGGNDVPRAAVIHDLRWSAIQMAQIEGRTHRDGRHAPTYWVFAADTVEERIARVVATRVRNMKALVGDDAETMREIEDVLMAAA